jgi:hypothetical protein
MAPKEGTVMLRCRQTLVIGLLVVSAPALPAAAPTNAKPSPAVLAFFETRVRPVLAQSCYRCHGPKKQKGKLRLDSRTGMLTGGSEGPAIVPGEPERSLLVKAIQHTDAELKMPPSGKLGKQQVADLVAWIKMGAPWPGSDNSATAPVATHETFQVSGADRKHWAFQPVRRPPVPARGGNPIDAYVRRGLETKGLTLAAPATKRELIRRAYFDLIGLPPTPEEIDTFIADRRPDAYERLLNRLLAMPQYGERWGRHWLDVVRFAQTHGYERDDEKPEAWRYRDYVIRSFNEDKPYDHFVREQIAGDEMEPRTDDSLTATAFFRLGVWDDEPDDARQAEFDNLDDILSTTAEAFLGVSLGCARCHDHKFDPFGQEDYYSMLAFYRNVKPIGRDRPDTILLPLKAGGKTLGVKEDAGRLKPTHVLLRGSAASPGKEVQLRFIRVLCSTDEAAVPQRITPPQGGRTTGRRRALAEWIGSKDNPLTARVMVNRLWQHHFGRGLVATPNDFGRNGARPTHPELLDYLAAELVEGGWRLKRLHRLIMLSDIYRQSSRVADEKGMAQDPDNTLLWHQNLRRLEAEAIRDAMLAVSGRLNRRMGGRGIFPDLPPEVLSTQSRPGNGWGRSSPEERSRRSVYIFVKRTLGVPLLDTFDFASPDRSIAARTTTTIAPQALILINGSFTSEQASAFADRLLRETGPGPERNIERAFRLALGRKPTEHERSIAVAFLERERAALRAVGKDDYRLALANLCKLVLNLNEFVYVD